MVDYAICIRNASKAYGKREILKNFNMRVQKGTIYGLLGASGCGKTTLLSCIAGRKKIDFGEIWVLGGVPGTEQSGVPGSRIGYMPQDINLVGEFTVKGAIHYFGQILDMDPELIEERFSFLKKLLDLPPDNRMIKNCSGGQQRRISFAASLIHKPELLILDEPTVGLDPILRDSIWNYLMEIVQRENTAIVVTTHYIEEAKQANQVGLMRGGRLLTEDSPDRLLTQFQSDTLEEVFLILCKQQEEGQLQNQEYFSNQNTCAVYNAESEDNVEMSQISYQTVDVLTKLPLKKSYKSESICNRNHLKALMRKNWLQYFRNTAGIGFNLVFPILEMLAFFTAIGGDIKNISVGVVNDENIYKTCNNYIRENTATPLNFLDCEFKDLSCRFLDDIEDPMINKIYYQNLDHAIQDIEHGKIAGVIYFAKNFSQSYQRRLERGSSIDDESLETSQIKVWLDMSNRQIGSTIKFKLLKEFLDFQKYLSLDCNLLEKIANIPIRFNYEYGDDKQTYTVYMIPGVLLTIMFFMGTTMTSTIIITDRLEGVWDRTIVAGVSSFEILLTHFATQIIIIVMQVTEVLILTFTLYGTEYVGSFALIICLVVLEGLCGMSFGFWVSVISDNHNMANIITTGSFYPMIFLCGLVWPLEAQPPVLRFISMCLPFTTTITSLRNVMKKGWSADNLEVLSGIAICLLWIFSLSLISFFLVKRKR